MRLSGIMPVAVAVAVALSIGGCSLPGISDRTPWSQASASAGQDSTINGDATIAVPPVVGHVDFSPTPRRVQTSVGYVAVAATVALLDTVTGDPVATTLTDPRGSFSLSFHSGFVPVLGSAYILEAYKGLDSNAAGSPAVRVRTLLAFAGGMWRSLPHGGVVAVDSATTALTILGQDLGVDPLAMLNHLETSGSPAIDAETGVSQSQFDTVLDLIAAALEADMDPVSAIGFDGHDFVSIGPQRTP